MSKNVLKLCEKRERDIDQTLIDLLGDLLERVKSGEVVSLTGVGECLDGGVIFYRSGSYSPYSTMGALDALKTNIYIDSLEIDDD